MLKILQDGQEKSIGYQIENNMLPSTDQALRFMKNALYEHSVSRFRDSGSDMDYGSLYNYYSSDYYLFQHTFLNPHPLITGMMELLDEENNVVCAIDLFAPYSGDDTTRGSLNRKESYQITLNEVVKNRLVVDIPTHSSNSAPIKTIRVRAYNKYYSSSYTYTDNKPDYKMLYKNIRRDLTLTGCIDTEGNLLTLQSDGLITYKNKMYQIDTSDELFQWTNGGSTNYSINKYRVFYLDGKFYLYENYSTTYTQILLKPLVFSENEGVVTVGTPIKLTFNAMGSSSTYRPELYNLYKNGDEYVVGLYTQSSYYATIVTYDKNWEKISQTSNINLNNSYMNIACSNVYIQIPPNDDGLCVARYYYDSKTTYYFKWDFVNKQVVLSTVNDGASIDTCTYSSYVAYYKGDRYAMIWQSDDTSSYGYGHGRSICKATKTYSDKYPIKITLDEPIQKTKDQTLKIVLDVEIE